MERLYRNSRRGKTNATSADITPDIPFSLITSAQGGIRIVAMSLAAREAGVKKNQLLPNAKSLCPSLRVFEHDPAEDKAELERLTLWTIRYSPWVAINPPDGIMIDITGCAHLVGGEKNLIDDLRTRLSSFGFSAFICIADTIGAAWAISHFGNTPSAIVHGNDALRTLPIDALRIEENTCERLKKVGFKTIGALMNKPRAPLAARYGEHLTERLDQAMGKKPESLSPIKEPSDYHVPQSFAEPVLLLDQISCCLDELALSMADMLDKEGLGARWFTLSLYRVDGDVRSLDIRTSTLTSEADHIIRLMNEKLCTLGENYDTGFGIELITLGAYFTETISHSQITLSGKRDSGSLKDFQALIDRYGNRLGFESVGKFMPCESHIPERSEKLIPISEQEKKTKNWSSFLKDLQGGAHLGRPILLLPRPEPITAIAEVPDGPPIRFEWRRLKYRIIRAEGPERLAPEWWKPMDIACEPTRDYFRVEDDAGGRFWLFRRGLYEREKNPKWFMHGFFA